MNRRSVLTELGPDHQALRGGRSRTPPCSISASARCRRISACASTIATSLRGCANFAGRAVFEPGNPAMGMILAANPHRVFISRLGRIEVYQPIPPPSGKSPEGPHTHVLPKLLKSGRTHPATEPVPRGWIPCAHLYPPHPARDGLGEARPFDATHHDAFQRMMAAFGDPEPLRSSGASWMRCLPASRPRRGRRSPRPHQRPHCVAANEGAGTCVSGAERLACELRFCGPRRGRRRSRPSS